MPANRSAVPFCLLLAVPAAVPVARADGVRAEVTPFVGYRIGGGFDAQAPDGTVSEGVDVEDSGSWGVDFGICARPDACCEFLYSTQTTGFEGKDPLLGSVDLAVEYYQFGGTAFFPGEQWPVPFQSLTIGATRFSADKGYGSGTEFFCVSDGQGAGCLVRSSGGTHFQAEATLGVTLRF